MEKKERKSAHKLVQEKIGKHVVWDIKGEITSIDLTAQHIIDVMEEYAKQFISQSQEEPKQGYSEQTTLEIAYNVWEYYKNGGKKNLTDWWQEHKADYPIEKSFMKLSEEKIREIYNNTNFAYSNSLDDNFRNSCLDQMYILKQLFNL